MNSTNTVRCAPARAGASRSAFRVIIRRAIVRSVIAATLIALGLSSGATALLAQETPATQETPAVEDWPRQRVVDDGTVVSIHRPQVDSWDLYVKLRFRSVMGVTLPDASAEVLGAVVVTADTETSFESRTVAIYNMKVVEASFPSMDAEGRQAAVSAIETLAASPQTLALDEVLAYVVDDSDASATVAAGGGGSSSASAGGSETPASSSIAAAGATSAAVDAAAPQIRTIESGVEPPTIYFTTEPAILVLYDGDPIFSPIEGLEVLFAVNTNWDVFLDQDDGRYFLRNEDMWLHAKEPIGPWSSGKKPPKSLSKLPAEQWEKVLNNIPGREIKKDEVPTVYVISKPAEMILCDGDPELERIPDTQLSYVSNTDSDLFLHSGESQYYFLISGRWFRATELTGPWTATGQQLPSDFASIPEEHARGRVLASVPGTPQAEEAVHLAQIPEKAEVKRDLTIEVTYDGEPKFETIEGSDAVYAVNTAYDVFMVDETFYCCHQAVWFTSKSPHGPWVVADSIPQAIYDIPPDNPKHNVTYVHVYESSPDEVVVGHTAGYIGMFVWAGCVVWGTGYHYPPYYYPARYPVYYGRPYSYGAGAYYNPNTGTYGRGAVAYGPYGGAGRGAAYNPRTGTYARGAAAYGPYQSARAGRAYNPRTGTGAAGYQRSTPYAQWGESVTRRGDDWVHKGHYSDARGTVAGAETSGGGKVITGTDGSGRTTLGKSESGDLYAGKDGNVYKREDGSWYKNDGGDWSPAEKKQNQELSAEQRQAAEDRAGQRSGERAGTGGTEGTQRSDASRDQARTQSSQRSQSERSQTMSQLDKDARSRSRGTERSRSYSQQRQRGGSGGRGGGRRR